MPISKLHGRIFLVSWLAETVAGLELKLVAHSSQYAGTPGRSRRHSQIERPTHLPLSYYVHALHALRTRPRQDAIQPRRNPRMQSNSAGRTCLPQGAYSIQSMRDTHEPGRPLRLTKPNGLGFVSVHASLLGRERSEQGYD